MHFYTSPTNMLVHFLNKYGFIMVLVMTLTLIIAYVIAKKRGGIQRHVGSHNMVLQEGVMAKGGVVRCL